MATGRRSAGTPPPAARTADELLVNTHQWGVNAFGAPVWHLRENQDGRPRRPGTDLRGRSISGTAPPVEAPVGERRTEAVEDFLVSCADSNPRQARFQIAFTAHSLLVSTATAPVPACCGNRGRRW